MPPKYRRIKKGNTRVLPFFFNHNIGVLVFELQNKQSENHLQALLNSKNMGAIKTKINYQI